LARALGIDYGNVHIGLSVSDEGKRIARSLSAIRRGKTDEETAQKILSAMKPLEPIDTIVVGLPLMLSGKEGTMALQAKAFAAFLEKALQRTVILWDERLTTVQVERTLKEAGLTRKKRSEHVDAMAAAAILQNYLDFLR
jgi:putative Holliday junction resolvase